MADPNFKLQPSVFCKIYQTWKMTTQNVLPPEAGVVEELEYLKKSPISCIFLNFGETYGIPFRFLTSLAGQNIITRLAHDIHQKNSWEIAFDDLFPYSMVTVSNEESTDETTRKNRIFPLCIFPYLLVELRKRDDYQLEENPLQFCRDFLEKNLKWENIEESVIRNQLLQFKYNLLRIENFLFEELNRVTNAEKKLLTDIKTVKTQKRKLS